MKPFFILLGLSLVVALVSSAQDFKVPNLPASKEELIKSKKDFFAAEQWLETHPIGQQTDLRNQINTYVLGSLVPLNLSIQLRNSIVNLFDKNADLLGVYMAGYAKFFLENSDSTDDVKCIVAGIKAAIKCYKLGGGVIINNDMERVIEAEKNEKLEEWVKKVL